MNDRQRSAIDYLFLGLGTLLALASFLSVWQNTSNRFLKMLDFPRLQFALLAGGLLIAYLVINSGIRQSRQWVTFGLLIATVGIQTYYLWPYLPVAKKVVPTAAAQDNTDRTIRLFLANVLMTNRSMDTLRRQIEDRRPDLLLLMEVDRWWVEQLQDIAADYPYRIEQPNDQAYGMLLYSRFPIKEQEIAYLSNEHVPSFHLKLSLPDGTPLALHAVHPVPPKHFDDLPDNAGETENALTKVGQRVAQETLPVIVAGDFNDVAWARTLRLMQAGGQLRDVRAGRGFYNSFDAHSWFMRWPLDHVLVTHHFDLAALERLDIFGSDHYPIYAELVLSRQ